MRIKKILTFNTIIFLVILLVIGLFLLPALRVPLEIANIGMATNRCRDITFFLEEYYEQLEQTADEPNAVEFVKFIENHRQRSNVHF